MDLAQALKERYGLTYCEVTLADPSSDDPALGIAQVAAAEIEKQLQSESPLVLGFGTGREIRGAVEQMSPMSCPHHKVVSLVGNLAPDGSASFNDVIMLIWRRFWSGSPIPGSAIQFPGFVWTAPIANRNSSCRQ